MEKKKFFERVNVNLKSVFMTVLAFVGITFIGLGVYHGFFRDFSWWQDVFCQAKIDQIHSQGYMMIAGGCLCLTGAAAQKWEEKLNSFGNKIVDFFKKEKKEEVAE